MGLQSYKLTAKSNLFIQNYDIQAKNLQEALKQVKIKFARKYNELGSNVKVSLQHCDVPNHIDEIINIIGGNKNE